MTSSDAILAALSAALFFSLADISLKKALQYSSPTMAINVISWIQWVLFTVICWVTGAFSHISNPTFPWFFLTGFMNPALFLFFYMLGIRRIGVVRSAPLKSCSPIVSVICAFVVLGERLAALQYVGIALTIGGLFVITSEGLRGGGAMRAHPEDPSRDAQGPPSEKGKLYLKLGYLFPILAGVSTGISSVLFKTVMKTLPVPVLGAWVGASLAVLLYPFVAFLYPPGARFHIHRSAWPWLIGGGVATTAAIYSLFTAIHLGLVSIVTTLYQISPLIILALAVLILRELERVTPRVVVGAILTVGGGIMVTIM